MIAEVVVVDAAVVDGACVVVMAPWVVDVGATTVVVGALVGAVSSAAGEHAALSVASAIATMVF